MDTTNKWGFLRETNGQAQKSGIDKDTGLHRTGLEDYLAVIFPEIPQSEWIHNRAIAGIGSKIRPDYRNEKLKLIIEFDGVQHYKDPKRIKNDYINQSLYERVGHTVVRIPYFIQLTNDIVEQLFNKKVEEPLFDKNLPSMGIEGKNTPAYCCTAGLKRMAKEFHLYPQQYQVNLHALQNADDEELSGAALLKEEYERIDKAAGSDHINI